MKTKESRFQVHDELTAPERSVPVLKGALAGGGQLPNFLGVLAGSPGGAARLRALPLGAAPRHAAATPTPAAHRARRRRAPGHRVRARALLAAHRPRRRPRPRRDRAGARVRLPRRARGRAAALRQGAASRPTARRRCTSTRRRARPAGTTSRSSRRSRTSRSRRFTNLVTRAGDVPLDGSSEESRLLDRRVAVYDVEDGLGAAIRDSEGPSPQGASAAAPRYHQAVELIGKRWTGAIVVRPARRARCASPRSKVRCPSSPTGCCPSA